MEKDAATSGHAADWHAVKESSTLPRSPNRERLAWTWEYIGGSLFMSAVFDVSIIINYQKFYS